MKKKKRDDEPTGAEMVEAMVEDPKPESEGAPEPTDADLTFSRPRREVVAISVLDVIDAVASNEGRPDGLQAIREVIETYRATQGDTLPMPILLGRLVAAAVDYGEHGGNARGVRVAGLMDRVERNLGLR